MKLLKLIGGNTYTRSIIAREALLGLRDPGYSAIQNFRLVHSPMSSIAVVGLQELTDTMRYNDYLAGKYVLPKGDSLYFVFGSRMNNREPTPISEVDMHVYQLFAACETQEPMMVRGLIKWPRGSLEIYTKDIEAYRRLETLVTPDSIIDTTAKASSLLSEHNAILAEKLSKIALYQGDSFLTAEKTRELVDMGTLQFFISELIFQAFLPPVDFKRETCSLVIGTDYASQRFASVDKYTFFCYNPEAFNAIQGFLTQNNIRFILNPDLSYYEVDAEGRQRTSCSLRPIIKSQPDLSAYAIQVDKNDLAELGKLIAKLFSIEVPVLARRPYEHVHMGGP